MIKYKINLCCILIRENSNYKIRSSKKFKTLDIKFKAHVFLFFRSSINHIQSVVSHVTFYPNSLPYFMHKPHSKNIVTSFFEIVKSCWTKLPNQTNSMSDHFCELIISVALSIHYLESDWHTSHKRIRCVAILQPRLNFPSN